MARKVLDSDDDGVVEFEEKATDPNGNSLSISLTWKSVDDGSGFSEKNEDSSNLSWLSFSKTENTLNDGSLEAIVTISIDKAGLDPGKRYKFEVSAFNGEDISSREFILRTLNTQFQKVMGQEDKFRHDGSSRIQNGGIARVIAFTTEEVKLDADIVANPANVDNPAFQTTQQDVSGGKIHEFNFGVNPSSLYAFKLKATPVGFDKTVESGINYLSTGDTINLSFEKSMEGSDFTETINAKTSTETNITGSGSGSTGPDSSTTIFGTESSTNNDKITSVSSNTINISGSINTNYTIS